MAVFVGRTQELRRLERRFDEALGGRGGVLFVTGEAGAGKSALTEQFLIQAALRAPAARVISAGCSEQYGAAEPYQPFVDAFRDLLSGGEPGAGKKSFGELARQLAPYWVQAIPVAGDIIAATMVTAAELKGSLGGATARAAPPSEEALFFQYTEVLLAAATEQPILLFIDDLHWADRASVSLLAHLARKVADKPVLIIGTYRPADVEAEGHPIKQAKLELERYGVAEELALPPLDPTSLAEFVQEGLGGPATPELLHLLEQRAGANPLFFGELLRWLVEQGIACEKHAEWRLAASAEEIEIPRSVESVIEKRLGRLDADLYRALEYASVEGDEFDSTLLARLLGMDELELEELIDAAVRSHRLVRYVGTRELPGGDQTSVYEFNHTLIQDVFHQNVHGKRRILLHRKIAEIIEEIYGTDTVGIAHKLAIHYDEGRIPEQACRYAMQAAERASRVYAHWDAIALLERAARNTQTDECRIEVLERLGEQNGRVGHYTLALEQLNEALELAGLGGEGLRTIRLRRKRVEIERAHGSRSADELLVELGSLAAEARDLGEQAELCEVLWCHSLMPGTAVDVEREALEIAERVGDPRLVARAHYLLSQSLAIAGNPEEAIPHARRALNSYVEQDHEVDRGKCHNSLGIAHVLLGDYREAVENFDAAASIFDTVGEPGGEAMVRNNLGPLLTQMGDWAGAEENIREAIRLCLRTDATARLLHPLENMARLHQAKGDADAAQRGWQELLGRAQSMGYWDTEIVARCGLGVLHLEAGDLGGAAAELAAARQLMPEEEEWTDYREDLELLAARLAAAQGEEAKALEILEQAEAGLAESDRYEWATYRLYHGEILSHSDLAQARAIAQEALAVFEQLGAEPMRRRAVALLAQIGGDHESPDE
ncbi:MAG: AAA family ATPase [Gemmatimonadetes bacterium]|nr:AAA family ATPase [Gemmatimonadota bacterium]NIO30628.1 AAA family ATPase [Gemmatimonadota bacterium]